MTTDKRYLDYAKVLQIRRLLLSGYSMRGTAKVAGVHFETVARYKAEMEADRDSDREVVRDRNFV